MVERDKGDVTIGHDVWIGHGVTILSGVTIGSGAIVGATSTVVKDVAPYQIVGGNPAKVIREKFGPDITALMSALEWWSLPVQSIKEISELLYTKEPTIALLEELISKYRKEKRL